MSLFALSANDAVGVSILAAIGLLVVLAGVRLGRKKHPAAPARPVSDQEIEEELEAGAEPTPVPAQPRAAKAPPEPSPPGLSREELEARKKAEYAAKKEAERLEKEQRRLEREAAEHDSSTALGPEARGLEAQSTARPP